MSAHGAAKRTCEARRSSAGFGLIELLVSLVIAMLAFTGALAGYARARDVQRTHEALARLNETSLYALAVVETDVRMAGYWGLAGAVDAVSAHAGFAFPDRCGGATWVTSVQPALTGTNNTYPSLSNCAPSGGAQTGADVIVVRRTSSERIEPAGPTVPSDHRDRVLAISRAGAAEIFVPAQLANGVPPGYPPGVSGSAPQAELRRVLVHAYYVSRGSSMGPDIPSLRRKVLRAGPTVADEEILAGVEDLQFRVGADLDGDGRADADFEPGQVPATASPRVVRLWLRLVSTERDRPPGGTTASNYADRAWPANDDGHSRLLVTRTIYLRNPAS